MNDFFYEQHSMHTEEITLRIWIGLLLTSVFFLYIHEIKSILTNSYIKPIEMLSLD